MLRNFVLNIKIADEKFTDYDIIDLFEGAIKLFRSFVVGENVQYLLVLYRDLMLKQK